MTEGQWLGETDRRAAIAIVVGVGVIVAVFRCVGRRQSFPQRLQEVRENAPKRDKEFPQRLLPLSGVPQPLEGCEDAVGGIESITIGSKRFWFGFSYQVDAVLSPLIDDPQVMAQFASDSMLQTTGAHPPEYWTRQVASAVDVSELASDAGDRDFTGSEIRDALREIEASKAERRLAKLELPDHLIYLFWATLKVAEEVRGPAPCSGKWEAAFQRLDGHGDCLDGALKVISGKAEPPAETDYEDALEVVYDYIAYWRRNVPDNWRTLLLHD